LFKLTKRNSGPDPNGKDYRNETILPVKAASGHGGAWFHSCWNLWKFIENGSILNGSQRRQPITSSPVEFFSAITHRTTGATK